MSVFLTPDLTPVAGGTYFPPKNTFGRPGFVTVLNSLTDQVIFCLGNCWEWGLAHEYLANS
jgi:Protein of unknown function, DUF255